MTTDRRFGIKTCSNCGITAIHAYGRCAACARYYKRTGQERPEGVIVRTARRKREEREFRSLIDPEPPRCGDRVFLGLESWTECDRERGHLAERHRSWVGEWFWDGKGNLVLERSPIAV